MQVEGRADDALALESRRVEVDEEELLRALELQFRRAAVVAFLFRRKGGDPGITGDFDAERFGGMGETDAQGKQGKETKHGGAGWLRI